MDAFRNFGTRTPARRGCAGYFPPGNQTSEKLMDEWARHFPNHILRSLSAGEADGNNRSGLLRWYQSARRLSLTDGLSHYPIITGGQSAQRPDTKVPPLQDAIRSPPWSALGMTCGMFVSCSGSSLAQLGSGQLAATEPHSPPPPLMPGG